MPDDRFFEPEIETMPRARIAALQEERILELVPYVYERSALVRKKWEEARVKPSDISSLADFTERVPFITKDDIRQFRDAAQATRSAACCAPDYADTTTVFSTSGTTGDATLYAHAWDRWHPFWAATARDLWEIGVRPGDYVLGSGFKMRGPLYHADQMCRRHPGDGEHRHRRLGHGAGRDPALPAGLRAAHRAGAGRARPPEPDHRHA